jgi:hypothetical protein
VVARKNVLLSVLLLGLGVAGIALAGVSTSAESGAGITRLNVVVADGRLTISPLRLSAGKVTIVAVNKGKVKHAVAIMGNGWGPKRTGAIAAGRTARLTVTLRAGKYHLWDPVTSSMSRAKYLTVRSAATPATSGGGMVTSGSSSGGSAGTGGSTAPTMTMTGMDGCDH